METPRERLEKFQSGVGRLSAALPDTMNSMLDFVGQSLTTGELSVREKELVAIGISMHHRCQDCIVVHTYKALDAGCTRQEILEAAGVALMMGGGPSLGASATVLLDCLDEFEVDFAKQGK